MYSKRPVAFAPANRLAVAALVSGGGAWAASTLARQFQYVYTPERQRKDLQRITDFVPDR